MSWEYYAEPPEPTREELKAEIERLRAALEEIAKHPRGGRIDTPEKLERDEMIGIARAALEAPQRRIDTAQPANGGEKT